MSKASESYFEDIFSGLVSVVTWCVIIYVAYSVYNSDWNLSKFFDKSVKKETWIEVERRGGGFSKRLDDNFAHTLIKNLKIKMKLRETTNQTAGGMDLACEIRVNLPRAVIANPDKYEEIDYGLSFTFKFIDEDGFILYSTSSLWFENAHEHERYKLVDLRHFWKDPDAMNVVSKFILKNRLDEKTAKRIVKIVYEPKLEVIRSKLKEN